MRGTRLAAEVRLYERLFDVADPIDDSDGKTYRDHLNQNSKRVVRAWLEPSLGGVAAGTAFQFERLGFFVADLVDHRTDRPVFNRTVTLRDTWARGPDPRRANRPAPPRPQRAGAIHARGSRAAAVRRHAPTFPCPTGACAMLYAQIHLTLPPWVHQDIDAAAHLRQRFRAHGAGG